MNESGVNEAGVNEAAASGSYSQEYYDFMAGGDALTATLTQELSGSAAAADSASLIVGVFRTASDSANSADTLLSGILTFYLETAGVVDTVISQSSTTCSLLDAASVQDIAQLALSQLIQDSANGQDIVTSASAALLIDLADATGTFVAGYNGTVLVAEIIALLEAYGTSSGYDVSDGANLSDAHVAYVRAVVNQLEAATAVDTDTFSIQIYQLYTDSGSVSDASTYTGSLINAFLEDGLVPFVKFNVGGETFTGWVLNIDSAAFTEYQFADRQFNSACKYKGKYLLAADDGIYQFTEDTSVETIMTYIKTGKSDFGSDLKKRIVNSYVVYSATGQMVLKVTTSEFGKLQTRNYRLVKSSHPDTTDVRRVDIGRGIKSRYWQFELLGDGVDCDIDEIGVLPVVLSRRL